MFNAPAVVVALAVAFVAIYAAFDWAGPRVQDLVLVNFCFVPGRLTVSLWPAEAIRPAIRAKTDPAVAEQICAMHELHAVSGGLKPWTVLTYAFLHGSWTHVLLNTVWLVAFGPPVARRFGTAQISRLHGGHRGRQRTCAVGERPDGVCAAHRSLGRRFGSDGRGDTVHLSTWSAARRFGLKGSARGRDGSGRVARRSSDRRRARIFLVIWLVTNFVFGAFARPLGLSDMPVAWVAHLGGFAAGIVLFPLFDRTRKSLPTSPGVQ